MTIFDIKIAGQGNSLEKTAKEAQGGLSVLNIDWDYCTMINDSRRRILAAGRPYIILKHRQKKAVSL